MLHGIRTSQTQNARHTAYWAERNSRKAPEGAFLYVALGDSTAVGVGIDDVDDGYVMTTARRLAEKLGRDVQLINLGVSGAKVEHLVESQLPQLANLPEPDLVTCDIGSNNVAWDRKFDPARFAASFETVVERLPERSFVGLVPSFGESFFEHRVRRANRVISSAVARHGHLLADVYSPTSKQTLIDRWHNLAGDKFHPNHRGYAMWADAFWRVIEPTL